MIHNYGVRANTLVCCCRLIVHPPLYPFGSDARFRSDDLNGGDGDDVCVDAGDCSVGAYGDGGDDDDGDDGCGDDGDDFALPAASIDSWMPQVACSRLLCILL